MKSPDVRNLFGRFRALICVWIILTIGQTVFAQSKPSIKWARFNFLSIDSIWKYNGGIAKPEYFTLNFDDQKWQEVTYKSLEYFYSEPTWSGIGVFRKTFFVPDSLRGKPAELFLSQAGASEIYLDGLLLCRFGKISGTPVDQIVSEKPIQLTLNRDSTHVLAIYHSNHIKSAVITRIGYTGFGIELSPFNPTYGDDNDLFHHAIISLCVILVFCLFFCFVYGFYPYRLASLMSACYLANFSLIFIGGLIMLLNRDVDEFIFGNNLWQTGFACNQVWNLLFLYALYYKKLPKRHWIPTGVMIIFLLFIFFSHPLPIPVLLPILILFQVECWRMIVLGIRKKRTGFWIIAIGELISLLGSLIAIFDVFNFFPWYLTFTQTVLAIVTDLSFPLTLALQFAWEFGSANRDLRTQLVQVNDLSKKNIEQEKEKQHILFSQNETLEKQVSERTSVVVAQNREIEKQRDQVTQTLEELRGTQKQLIQSEKMASLGELTAGIAHEIQNPLNFVNNFSEVNAELIEDAGQEIEKGNISELKMILNALKENEQKINHHGKRADSIVKGMLQHSRSSGGTRELTDINELCDKYLRLSYHGLRAKDKTFNAKIETDFDISTDKINVVPQDIGRVILNLINNAFYAVSEKSKAAIPGFEPTVLISTRKIEGNVQIKVKDNGNGIPDFIKDKIFQPFFTTKPTGEGTGLGLSLSYDIVKAHGGEINVETNKGEGSEFVISFKNGPIL